VRQIMRYVPRHRPQGNSSAADLPEPRPVLDANRAPQPGYPLQSTPDQGFLSSAFGYSLRLALLALLMAAGMGVPLGIVAAPGRARS